MPETRRRTQTERRAEAERRLLDAAMRLRDARVFLVLWAEAIASDEELRPVFAERDAAFRQGWADAIRAGVADGSIRPDADAEAAAVALAALTRGAGLQ